MDGFYDTDDEFYDAEEPPYETNSLQSNYVASIMETSRNPEPTSRIEKIRIGRPANNFVPYKMFENGKLVDTDTSSIEPLQISPLDKYIDTYKSFIIKLVCEDYKNIISNICPTSMWKNMIKKIIENIRVNVNDIRSKERILLCYTDALKITQFYIYNERRDKSLLIFDNDAKILFHNFRSSPDGFLIFLNFCSVMFDTNIPDESKLVGFILFFNFLKNLKQTNPEIFTTSGGRKSKRKRNRTKKIKRTKRRQLR